MSLVAYPESFPIEALVLLRDKIKGEDVPVSKLSNAAWNVVGYGLSLGLPVKDQMQPVGAAADESLADLSDLNELIEGHESGSTNFPIALVALALKIALKFLL